MFTLKRNESNKKVVDNYKIQDITNFFKHFKLKDLKYMYTEQNAIYSVILLDKYDFSYPLSFYKNGLPTLIDTRNLSDNEKINWFNKMTALISKYDGVVEYISGDIFLLANRRNEYEDEEEYEEELDEDAIYECVDKNGIPYELHGKTKVYNIKDLYRLK